VLGLAVGAAAIAIALAALVVVLVLRRRPAIQTEQPAKVRELPRDIADLDDCYSNRHDGRPAANAAVIEPNETVKHSQGMGSMETHTSMTLSSASHHSSPRFSPTRKLNVADLQYKDQVRSVNRVQLVHTLQETADATASPFPDVVANIDVTTAVAIPLDMDSESHAASFSHTSDSPRRRTVDP
jgi:hypothetical protein